MEEDEGTTTSVEGRVIHHRQVVSAARGHARGLADRLRPGARPRRRRQVRRIESPRDIFEELRVASQGRRRRLLRHHLGADRSTSMGVFWPCPSLDHPGTPRLYEGGRFGHADGKAHFQPVEWRPAAEEPDDDYPIVLTTGRVVAHYLSGTQTRRIGALVDQMPAALLRDPSAPGRRRSASPTATVVTRREPARRGRRARAGGQDHPARHRVRPLSLAARSRRPTAARSARSIRSRRSPSTRSARCACEGRAARRRDRRARARGGRACDERAGLLHRLLALHRLPGVRAGVRGVRHAPRAVDDPPRDHRAPRQRADGAAGVHALRGSDLRARLPGRRHQADARRRRPELAQAALHRLLELRARLSVRRAEVRRRASIR